MEVARVGLCIFQETARVALCLVHFQRNKCELTGSKGSWSKSHGVELHVVGRTPDNDPASEQPPSPIVALLVEVTEAQ